MWIAQYDRMPTRARLLSWGLGNSANCCLCDSAIESRDHLLLRCEVSKQIWTLILRRLGYNHSGFHTWTALFEWLSLKDSHAPLVLKRLVSHATIYCIWAGLPLDWSPHSCAVQLLFSTGWGCLVWGDSINLLLCSSPLNLCPLELLQETHVPPGISSPR